MYLFPHRILTEVELVLEVALGEKPLKTRFRDWFGHAHGLEHSADIPTTGTKDANNSRHAVASQLIKLPPVVDSDKVPTAARALGV